MKNFSFSFPSKNAEENNIVESNNFEAAVRELTLMIRSKQQLTILFYVKKDTGKPMMLVSSPLVSKFSVPLTQELFNDSLVYVETGEAPSGDYPDLEPIDFEGDTNLLQETILRQWIEDGKTIQFMPTFRDRDGKLKGIFSRRFGKVKFEVARNDDFDEFLNEHGYNV